MRRILALATAAALVVAAYGEDDAKTLVFRFAPSGAKVSANVVASKLTERWRRAGFFAVTADAATTGDRVIVRVPPADATHEADIRRLAGPRGRVEFRVRADEKVEADWASRVEGYAQKPDGFEWLPKDWPPHDTRKDLVEVARGDQVFVNDGFDFVRVDDLTYRCVMCKGGITTHKSVRFSFPAAREAAFARFLDDHAGRRLCVVVDGAVHDSPKIPRGLAELIARDGLLDRSDQDALDLGALLASGPLPCTLVEEK